MSKGKNRKLTLSMVYDRNNMLMAEHEARIGKPYGYGMIRFDKNYDKNIDLLCESIKNHTFKTSQPKFEERFCVNKTRILTKVKYIDHVAHHALMRVIMPTLVRSYYYESAASIPGRGVDYAMNHVRKFIHNNRDKELWWAELDFVKFYHNIDRQRIYDRLCKTFTDKGIRYLIHDVIWSMGNHNGLEPSDGTRGLGIGLYPVQPFVNFYLNDLDRELASINGIRNFRYCDNILIIGFSPEAVQQGIDKVITYTKEGLNQPLHTNVGIQKVDDKHPIIYVGRKFYKNYTLIAKKTKERFIRKSKKLKGKELLQSMASYHGMIMHIDGHNLWKKYCNMHDFKELKIEQDPIISIGKDGKRMFNVEEKDIRRICEIPIAIYDFEEGCKTKHTDDAIYILYSEIETPNVMYKTCTTSNIIREYLRAAREQSTENDNFFPFAAKIVKKEIIGSGNSTYSLQSTSN